MQIGRIKDATRVIGQRQGYMGLPLRDELINCSVNGPINSMVRPGFRRRRRSPESSPACPFICACSARFIHRLCSTSVIRQDGHDGKP